MGLKVLTLGARLLGTLSMVRLRQLWKCRWFLLSSAGTHEVRPVDQELCEYLVITARRRGSTPPPSRDHR